MEKIVLGHKFTEMTSADFRGFAGADEGTMICYLEGSTLFLCPDGQLVEVDDEGTETVWTKKA